MLLSQYTIGSRPEACTRQQPSEARARAANTPEGGTADRQTDSRTDGQIDIFGWGFAKTTTMMDKHDTDLDITVSGRRNLARRVRRVSFSPRNFGYSSRYDYRVTSGATGGYTEFRPERRCKSH
jgi:hypothetical protein